MKHTAVIAGSVVFLGWSALALAEPGYHPWAPTQRGPKTVDLSAEASATASTADPPAPPSLHELDAIAADPPDDTPRAPGQLPEGWVQQGGVVMPKAVADGVTDVDPEAIFAVEDIPGNEYPRKHTVYLNFVGGMLYAGADNSAESKSTLAKQGEYPAFTGGEAKAISAAQGFANDVAAYGIRVVYEQRPPKILPYTMVMIGGHWTDTNLEDSAAGVAPGADCGALGQRHVVYTFADAGWGATSIANVTSQEAGHAWGLDHSFNCGSVMAYCGGGDKIFSSTCDGLCESQCQGQAGCRLTHEMFCGVGNDQQNEHAELSWIFGTNEPDIEPPTVEIVEPADGSQVEVGADVDLRALVDDNYGGYGWRFVIEHDGEVVYDQVDYGRDVDGMYRAALNLVKLEEGVYEITVEIMDHGDNVSSDTVVLEVVPSGGSGDPTGNPSSDGGSDGAGETTTAGGTDGGTSGATSGPATDGGGPQTDGPTGVDDPSGCGCRTSNAPAAAWAALVLVAALRRRRHAPLRR